MRKSVFRAMALALMLSPVLAHASSDKTATSFPVLSTAPAMVSETFQDALAKGQITYSNIWADDQGHTHITKCVVKGLKLASFAAKNPYFFGVAPENIASIVISVEPVGWYGTWHRAPGPQWVIDLSGAWEVQTTDGSTLRQGPGEFQFNSDAGSFSKVAGGPVGHTAKQVGTTPNVRMIITLKKAPGESYTNQACVL